MAWKKIILKKKSLKEERLKVCTEEVGVEGATGRIKRAGRSSRNGTCPKAGLHAAVALHSAPGKLIYKFRGGPRVASFLRKEREQK